MVILHQYRFDESVKLLGPFFRFEPRRGITRNQEQRLFDDEEMLWYGGV